MHSASRLEDKQVSRLELMYRHLTSQIYVGTKSELTTDFCRTITSQIPLLHETIKTLHFLFSCKTEAINKHLLMSALDLLVGILNTCSIPGVQLTEIYLLPYLEESARYILDSRWRTVRDKQNISKPERDFCRKCVQIIAIWSAVKPKRLFEAEEMNQDSSFASSLDRLSNRPTFQQKREYICGAIMLPRDTVSLACRQLRPRFLQELDHYGGSEINPMAHAYSQFYRNLALDKDCFRSSGDCSSITSREIIQDIMKPSTLPVRQLPEIDPKQLLQSLDPVITTPLNKSIVNILEGSGNFEIKAQAIVVFTLLLKSGDLESYLLIVYCEIFYSIGVKLSEVNGSRSLQEGAKIFPELGPIPGKKQFYCEFLRLMEVFAHCIDEVVEEQIQTPRLRQLYYLFKKKKVIFPQNLMLKQIQQSFQKALNANVERNQVVLYRLKHGQSSVAQIVSNLSSSKIALSKFKQEFDILIREGLNLFDRMANERSPVKQTENIESLQIYINDLKLEMEIIESEITEVRDELEEGLNKGNFIIQEYDKLEPQCKLFLQKKITLDKFKALVPTEKGLASSLSQQNPLRIASQISYESNGMRQKSGRRSINIGKVQRSPNSRKESQDRLGESFAYPTKSDKSISGQLPERGINFKDNLSHLGNNSVCYDQSKDSFQENSYNFSISTRNNRSIQFPKTIRKSVTHQLGKIITNLQAKQSSQQYGRVLDPDMSVNNISVSKDYIMQPGLNPLMESFNVESVSPGKRSPPMFKDCLNFENVLNNDSYFTKSMLKNKQQGSRSSLLNTNEPSSNSRPSVEPRPQTNPIVAGESILLLKQNPIPDRKVGRLINFSNQPYFLKEAYQNDFNKSIAERSPKLCQHSHLNIEAQIQRVSQTLTQVLLTITPAIKITALKLKTVPTQQRAICLKQKQDSFRDLVPKKPLTIHLFGELKGLEQLRLPQICIDYRTESFSKQILVQLPLTLHAFVEYSQVDSGKLRIWDSAYRIIRSEVFESGNDRLEKYFNNLSLIYQGECQVWAVRGVIPNCKFQIYVQKWASQAMILAAVREGQALAAEQIISIVRSSLIK